MNRKVRTIATHEYVGNVRRKEFIAITLGLPILMFVLVGISALGAAAAFQNPKNEPQIIGIVNRSDALALISANMPKEIHLVEYREEAEGEADIKKGKIKALLVVGANYLENGQVTVYRKGDNLFSQNRSLLPIETLLTRALLIHAGTDPRLLRRAIEPAGPEGIRVLTLDKSGRFVTPNMTKDAARFAVPYAFTILLTTAIFIAANYLLRGIADEKENRVIEIILSSVTPEELLHGKLIGQAGVGLTQVGVWIGLAALPLMLRYSSLIQLSPWMLLGVLFFFALGFGLYATVMAGLGALGTSYRESQQIAGVVSMGAFLPFVLFPVLIEFPNGGLARVLSFIPFTAPTVMVLRVSATDVPLLDLLLSTGIILLTLWLVLKLSAKLFRYGLLIYGKRPTFAETLRWLRQA